MKTLEDRIRGCWMGKSIGGTLGLPAEGRMERQHFTFYDPVPTVAPPNDDLELQLVWLHLAENAASALTQDDFARAWLDHIHYMWDEYGRCRWNLRRGVPVAQAGTFENHFASGMGSPIRSEIWACLFPGDPGSAARYAAMDASLDHGAEGIAGEVFFSVLQSLIAAGDSLEGAIDTAARYLPPESETARAIALTRESHRSGTDPWSARERLLAQHGDENFTHAPLNVALTLWALCHGDGDFEKTILLAVNGGYDTDCTAATAGATLGLMLGENGIPPRWIEPIGEGVFIGPGILGIDAPQTLTALTWRTLALVGKLRPEPWDAAWWNAPAAPPDLATLPGTVALEPFGSREAVAWANGELPPEIKRAGGGTWLWERTTDEPRALICLARRGARLFLDDRLLIECPPGLPYVPATHRSPEGSCVIVAPAPGRYQVRLQLDPSEEEASVILAYPNRHLAPWTAGELPDPACLPMT